MSEVHLSFLSKGKEIVRFLVLIVQPRTVFISSNVPSACSFFAEIMLTRGKESL